MVSHTHLDIFDAYLLRGFDIQRHSLYCLAIDVAEIFVHLGVHHTEKRPNSCLAETQPFVVERVICVGETKIFVPAVVITLCTSKANDIFGVHTVIFVFERYLCYPCLIGVSRYTIVGDTYSHPYGSFLAAAFAYHLHYPHLTGVCDREAFARRAVAVTFHEVGHHLDGFSGSLSSLQRNVDKASVVHYTLFVLQFFTSRKCCLTNAQLVFVHIAHHLIGVFYLVYFTSIFTCIPLVDFQFFIIFVVGSGIEVECSIEPIRVGRIRYHRRAVGRGFTPNQKVCTGKRCCRCSQKYDCQNNR